MTSAQALPTRRLGKTNLQVPILGVGGWHIGEKRDLDLGRRIIRTALDEALKAREEGKIRFIGFTGHRHPSLLREMLDGEFDWDTMQFPTNLLDNHYCSFVAQILPIATKRDIGVIGMKSLAGDGKSMFAAGVTAKEAMGFALSLPIATLVSGMDSPEQVTQNAGIARGFTDLSDSDRKALLDRVKPHAADGHLEGYKQE